MNYLRNFNNMIVSFSPSFLKKCGKLPAELQTEVKEKISLFQQDPGHSFLKTHKLRGELRGKWSFSVNYSYRIVFQYLSKKEVVLLCVGNHDVYK